MSRILSASRRFDDMSRLISPNQALSPAALVVGTLRVDEVQLEYMQIVPF